MTSKFVKSTKCKCGCGIDNVNPELLKKFDEIVEQYFNSHEVIVSCVCRCEKHNKEVGGAKASLHLASKSKQAKAIDFNIAGYNPSQVQAILNPIWNGGMEFAPTWTHLDLGSKRRFKP